jgi:hypothetical protein
MTRSLDTHSGDPCESRRIVATAAERNKNPILLALQAHLRHRSGPALEVASGTGQHVLHFAAALPDLVWQPTELAADTMDSIAAWTEGLPNVRPPALLDCARPDTWPSGATAGNHSCVLCINMTHISPWASTEGLLSLAAAALRPGGQLFLYGPFSLDGLPHTAGNVAFDLSLRTRNTEWGYRDVAEVAATAEKRGLKRTHLLEMPADNFMLVFERG